MADFITIGVIVKGIDPGGNPTPIGGQNDQEEGEYKQDCCDADKLHADSQQRLGI
jgi:hypothetical protein